MNYTSCSTKASNLWFYGQSKYDFFIVLPLVINEQNKWSESQVLYQWMPLEGQQQIDMNDILGNLEETCLWCTTCTFSCVKTHLQNSAHDLPSLLSVLGWCPHFSRSFENEIWRTLCGASKKRETTGPTTWVGRYKNRSVCCCFRKIGATCICLAKPEEMLSNGRNNLPSSASNQILLQSTKMGSCCLPGCVLINSTKVTQLVHGSHPSFVP